MRFSEETAIVTGGASGIGKAVVKTLASEGASTAILDINLQSAQNVAEEASSQGGKAIALYADVTQPDSMNEAVSRAIDEFGHIDILVSNAGWDEMKPFNDTDPSFWHRVVDINYLGHLAVIKAVLSHMIEHNTGRIVTVASDAGRVGSSGEVVYSGAKGGVIAFTKALAREVSRNGIRINCVCPGLVDTPLLASTTSDNDKIINAIVRSIPMKRVGQPQEIADAICFLASHQAEYITGQTLSVDGGLTML